jgi:hypothetical protein
VAQSRKPKNELEDKVQSARFVETARALEVDERPQSFERIFKKLAKPKTKKRRR